MDDVTKTAYSALTSLRGNPDFEAFARWIEAERERTKELLTQCSSEQHQRLQGTAQAFNTVLEMFRTAPDVIKRAKTTSDHPYNL